MSKEKDNNKKSDKTMPKKTTKEKRANKLMKRKNKEDEDRQVNL